MARDLQGRRAPLFLLLLAAAAGTGILLSFFLRPMVVVSGSMEPAIPTGSLTLVRVHSGKACAVGEVIVFRPPGREHLVVHRVVEIIPGSAGEAYITRGDNNLAPDRDPVPREAVVGSVAAVIPRAGPAAELLRTSPLPAALLGAACALLLFRYTREDLPRSASANWAPAPGAGGLPPPKRIFKPASGIQGGREIVPPGRFRRAGLPRLHFNLASHLHYRRRLDLPGRADGGADRS